MEEHFLALPLLPLLPSSFSAATGNPSTSSSAGCVEGSLSCRETVSGRTRDRTASGQGNSSSTEEDIAALKKRRAKRQAKKAKRQQASKSGAQEPAIPQGITVEVVECDGKAGGDAEVEEVGERGEDFDEAPRRLADGVPTMDFLAKRVAVMMLKEGGPGMADSLSDIGSSKEVPVSKAILSAVPSTKTLLSAGLNLAGIPCTESEGLTLALPEKKSLEKKRSSTSSLPRDESPASRSGCDVPPIPGNRLAPKTAKQLKELIKEEKKAQKKALKALNKSVYEPYATPESILAHPGLYDGGLEKGTLVISQKSPDQAYVRLPGKPNDDINIANVLQRNRALSGDVVVVEIAPRTEWKVRPDFVEEVQTALGVDTSGKRLAPSKNSVRTTGKKGGVSVPGAAQSVQACSSGGNQVRQSQNQGQKWMNILMENMDLADAPEQWLQKTGKVVCIVEASGTRQLVGKLGKVPTTNGVINPVVFRLSPTDSRMPDVSIRANEVPADLLPLLDSKKYLKEQLFLVDIMEWPETHSLPYGRIVKPIGVVGDVDTYTASILVENCIDETVLPAAVLEQIVKPFTNEMRNAAKDAGRQDFRGDCVFTIDPPDAKDLDDAVSCHALGNGIYSVGVHIADVSFYIAEGTPIDLYARQRGTSVYLVNKVVPMLPPKMIESVCSLDPGVERRTVSALFTITENGEVLDHFLTRGLIRSCAKLSYETAQRIIDDPYQVPTVALSASPCEADAIRQTILFLFNITQSLRRQRFERGGLRIDQPEFRFDLDGNGLPVAMVERDRFASCQLIEELALLTNMATAGIIREHFPEIALLRRHPSPMQSGLLNLQKFCHMNNLDMWIDTSKSIQMSMSNIVALEPRLDPILSYLCAKPMKLAEYVCTGQEIDTWHYALNVEEYTHMTSPIRRYPDIVVHRLLLAALGYTARPQISPDEMQAIADQCNARKISAGRCQEASLNLFLGLFIQRSGPMLEDGVVVAVYPHSLSVEILVPRLGFVERVFCQRAEFVTNVCHRSAGRSEPGSVGPRSYLELNWAKKQLKGVLKLGVMTRVPVVLSVGNKDARKLKMSLKVGSPQF